MSSSSALTERHCFTIHVFIFSVNRTPLSRFVSSYSALTERHSFKIHVFIFRVNRTPLLSSSSFLYSCSLGPYSPNLPTIKSPSVLSVTFSCATIITGVSLICIISSYLQHCILCFCFAVCPSHPAGWYSVNIVYLYSEGTWFESWLWYRRFKSSIAKRYIGIMPSC